MTRSLISSLALAAALGLAGAAIAQDASMSTMTSATINGVEISGDEFARVQARCTELQAEANASLAADDDDEDEEAEGEGAAAEPTENPVNGVDQALTSIDLETLTVEACVEAGIVTAAQ